MTCPNCFVRFAPFVLAAVLMQRQGAPDPYDDTHGGFLDQPDIAHVSAWFDASTLAVDVDFHTPIIPPDFELGLGVVGSLEIDVDADPLTGTTAFLNTCRPERTTGFEYFVTLFGFEPDSDASPNVGTAPILDGNFDTVGSAVVVYGSSELHLRLPLSVIPHQGTMDVALAVGTPSEPTDCAPDDAVLRAVDRAFANGFEP